MPWFRKDVKFKVVSPEEKHGEVKSEPSPESKPAELCCFSRAQQHFG